MKVQMINRVVIAGIALLAVVIGVGQVSASVVDLRNAAREESSLFHHYTFDATALDTDDMRFTDRAGSNDLFEIAAGVAHITNIIYEAGFDALSQAFSTDGSFTPSQYNLATLRTYADNLITLPSTITVECLVSPQRNDISFGVCVSAFQNNERGYYVLQQNETLTTRIGTGTAQTIVTSVSTGHWYYVVSTYTISGGNTTINSYYADLTATGTLQHAVVDYVSTGTHPTDPVRLSVGSIYNGGSQYGAAAAIDEVAFYDTVLSTSTISNHLAELYRELPTVEYRELFPSDNATSSPNFPEEGWNVNRGANAINETAPVLQDYNTAFDEDLLAVASDPSDTGVTMGYLNNYTGVTDYNYLYWTEEMVDNRLDVSWLTLVMIDFRLKSSHTVHLVMRVDTNGTPSDISNDAWFVSDDFDNDSGLSAIGVAGSVSAVWHRHEFDFVGLEWTTLDFTPGSTLEVGTSEVSLPVSGAVTGFGLLDDAFNYQSQFRVDNFTIYAHRVLPPKGTVIIVQ